MSFEAVTAVMALVLAALSLALHFRAWRGSQVRVETELASAPGAPQVAFRLKGSGPWPVEVRVVTLVLHGVGAERWILNTRIKRHSYLLNNLTVERERLELIHQRWSSSLPAVVQGRLIDCSWIETETAAGTFRQEVDVLTNDGGDLLLNVARVKTHRIRTAH